MDVIEINTDSFWGEGGGGVMSITRGQFPPNQLKLVGLKFSDVDSP